MLIADGKCLLNQHSQQFTGLGLFLIADTGSVHTVDKLIQYLRDYSISFAESFLVLTIERPDAVQGMDDLHYAVKQMLSCNNQDASQLIRVSSLNLS